MRLSIKPIHPMIWRIPGFEIAPHLVGKYMKIPGDPKNAPPISKGSNCSTQSSNKPVNLSAVQKLSNWSNFEFPDIIFIRHSIYKDVQHPSRLSTSKYCAFVTSTTLLSSSFATKLSSIKKKDSCNASGKPPASPVTCGKEKETAENC